ncbi:MAG: universal stress protein [Alphaproteobacteria bacterium]|nr:universal stress protein [Alphaproteobacteria bacterium]
MKRILIVIDGSANDAESLASAKTFAIMAGAHLTVAHARVANQSLVGFGEFIFAASDVDRSAQNEAQAKAAFDAVCGDLPDARFLVYDASCDTITAAIGYAYDLIMVERLSSEDGPEASNLNAALFETGRLVLLVPPRAASGPIKRAAIVWNSSAQTARAIKSALPLLQIAQDIVLLTGSGTGEVAVALLLEYLAAYDLAPSVQAYDSERLTARARGRALIAAAGEAGADLLVMGAFGEGQAGAIAGLGRATRKIVTAAPMPVLLQS